MSRINKELMKGSTAILVLRLLEERERYGYELAKSLEERSEGLFVLKEGTLYPILHAMEQDGWVEAYWREAEGRRRKYYRLTEEGRAQYAAKAKEWARFRSAVDRVLGEGNA